MFTLESPQMPAGRKSSGRRTPLGFRPALENAGLAPVVRFPGPQGTPGPRGLFLGCTEQSAAVPTRLPPAPSLTDLQPMLLCDRKTIPREPGWHFEIKFK
jgi:hypothetical protein